MQSALFLRNGNDSARRQQEKNTESKTLLKKLSVWLRKYTKKVNGEK